MRRLAIAIWLLPIGCAHAASTTVDPNSCGAIPESLMQSSANIVGADWPVYRPFMCLYPVKSPTGSTVLFLLALDTSKADAANSLVLERGQPVQGDNDGGKNDPIPPPAVIDRKGNMLAKFPDSLWFPTFDPATTSVLFSQWKNNFPYKFTLYVVDPTVSSPGGPYCPPPYMWDVAAQRYIQSKGDYYGVCPKQP